MPSAGTTTTGLPDLFVTSVANLESMASTALFLASDDNPALQSFADQAGEDVTSDVATDMFDELINAYFAGEHFVKVRFLRRVNFE